MRKVLFNVHLWGALIMGVFIAILGLTGSIIAFEEELDHAFNPALFHVQPGGQRLPTAEILARLEQQYPGQKFTYLRLSQDPRESYMTQSRAGAYFVNPYTAAVIGTRSGPTVLGNIHQLHLRLLMGKTGQTIVKIAASVLLFLVLSGVYLCPTNGGAFCGPEILGALGLICTSQQASGPRYSCSYSPSRGW